MKKYTREFEQQAEVNDNILTLSFASSAPYRREDKNRGEYDEILEISEEAIDFTRLVDNRAPLLLNHDTERQIGVVEKAYIQDGKLYAEVKFSDGSFAQQILNDVKQGIRRNTSIGYSIDKYVWTEGVMPTLIAKRWTPYEVSIVPVPADPLVGYQRSLTSEEDNEDMKKLKEIEKTEDAEETISEAEEVKEAGSVEEQTEETKEVCPDCGKDPCEKKECEEEKAEEEVEETESEVEKPVAEEEKCDEEEIRSLGELVNQRALAAEFITQKRSLEDFKNEIKKRSNLKENKTMAKFSLRKALLNATGRLSNEEAAYEREVIAENKRKFNVNDADIVLSKNEIRAFDGTEALNQVNYQPGMYAPNLRPAVTVDAVGTRKVAVTGQSISFSVCTSGLNAGFVDINGNVPSATMDFALKTLTPKKQGAFVDVSYQSLLQDDPSAEAIILDDITKALDQSKNDAFFNGLSGNNEPIGLLNVDGVNEVSISGTPTLSTALEFEKKIRESYDYSGDLKWVMGTGAYYKWASTPYSATEQNRMLVEDRKCIGYDVYVDATMPASGVILGNFDEALEADFDGIAIKIVEDATLARKQAFEIVAHRALDFCVRRPRSFTKGV